jgi:hypothetical protein
MDDREGALLLTERVRVSHIRSIAERILASRTYAYVCLAMNLGVVGVGAITAAVGVSEHEPFVAATGGVVSLASFAVLQNISKRFF